MVILRKRTEEIDNPLTNKFSIMRMIVQENFNNKSEIQFHT